MGRIVSDEQKAKTSLALTGRKTTRTVVVKPRIENVCEGCGNIFLTTVKGKKRFCSNKCAVNRPGQGGYREGSGRSFSGYYKGIFCASTYELVWVIYRLDHGLECKRFDGYLQLDNAGRKYFPDFNVDGDIVEIKGFWSRDVTDKTNIAKALGYNIHVKYKQDLLVEFDWVKQNYSYQTLKELYDGYKPKYQYVCGTCNILFNREVIITTDNKYCSRICSGKRTRK